jgi:hypothetical protein
MDFVEYYNTGEETPEMEDSQSEHNQVIDEGLIEVLFKTFRTNMKVNVSGPLIYFRWEWMNTKTYFTLKIRKKTFKGLMEWLKRIEEDAFDEAGGDNI